MYLVFNEQKFKNKFAGPYIISSVNSPHTYILKDPCTDRLVSQPVHINRLKPAYVRIPNPTKFLIDCVVTHQFNNDNDKVDVTEINTFTDQASQNKQDYMYVLMLTDIESKTDSPESDAVQNLRPKREKQKPVRFRDDNFVDPNKIDTSDNGSDQTPKVKRFLAQKNENGKKLYLAHIVGEPAQHAIWLQYNQLGPKATAKMNARQPPTI